MKLLSLEKLFCKNVDFGKIQDGRHSGAITPKGCATQMANKYFLKL